MARPELPSGTITFLFTDAEGSTRLLQEHGAAYADLLAEHRTSLRGAFTRYDGVEVDTQGDAFFRRVRASNRRGRALRPRLRLSEQGNHQRRLSRRAIRSSGDSGAGVCCARSPLQTSTSAPTANTDSQIKPPTR
jgi:class 3 adenylate cyclase